MNVREQLRHDWAAHIADYKASGLTMSARCTANQFKLAGFDPKLLREVVQALDSSC